MFLKRTLLKTLLLLSTMLTVQAQTKELTFSK